MRALKDLSNRNRKGTGTKPLFAYRTNLKQLVEEAAKLEGLTLAEFADQQFLKNKLVRKLARSHEETGERIL